MKTVLHLGCSAEPLPPQWYPPDEWQEIRVDADPSVEPEIVADVRDVPLERGCADAIHCFHVLEHLPEMDLAVVLIEFRRLLADDGELNVAVPDIQEAARWIAEGRGAEVMYQAQVGGVRALDVIYGFALAKRQRPLMSHLTGFTADTLGWWLAQAGFAGTMFRSEDDMTSIVARCRKQNYSPLRELLARHPGQGTILIQGGEVNSSEDKIDQLLKGPVDRLPKAKAPNGDQPEEAPPGGMRSAAGVSEKVEIGIIDPEDQ